MRRILISITCLYSSRYSLVIRREPGQRILAKASNEERILLYQLNSKVVNLLYIADACNKSAKLAERDSLLGINYYYKGVAICKVQIKYSFSQRQQDCFKRSVKVTIIGQHVYICGVKYKKSSLKTRDYSNSRSLIKWGVRLERALIKLKAWSLLAGKPLLQIMLRLLVHQAVLR